jgi:hypothetical protein
VAQFKVMTWNVENLFDVGDEDGPDSQAELKAKVESLRSVIDEQKPHVLGLQEIGSESALGKLQAALKTPTPHRAVAELDERGIRVAFLGRRVLHDPLQIRPFPGGLLPIQVGDDPPGPDGPRTMNLMGRAAMQVTVRANGRDVHVIAVHLKSKLLTFAGGFSPANEDQRARFAAYALYRRASEATTLRIHLDDLLDGQGQTRPVVLMGRERFLSLGCWVTKPTTVAKAALEAVPEIAANTLQTRQDFLGLRYASTELGRCCARRESVSDLRGPGASRRGGRACPRDCSEGGNRATARHRKRREVELESGAPEVARVVTHRD